MFILQDAEASSNFFEIYSNTTTWSKTDEVSHGTACAGIIAAVANNSYCGVGIAFNARIGELSSIAN